jgi:thioredoxin-dependent peroxiredoxin
VPSCRLNEHTLASCRLNEQTLQEIVKEKGAVIFVYPKANTPGCTKQACGFRDSYEAITRAGAFLVNGSR